MRVDLVDGRAGIGRKTLGKKAARFFLQIVDNLFAKPCQLGHQIGDGDLCDFVGQCALGLGRKAASELFDLGVIGRALAGNDAFAREDLISGVGELDQRVIHSDVNGNGVCLNGSVAAG